MTGSPRRSSEGTALRVVYVNHVSGGGGAEHSLVSLVRRIGAWGVEAYGVAPPGPLSESLTELGVPVGLVTPCRLHRTRNPLTLALQLHRLRTLRAAVRRQCAQVAADLVHANSLAAAVALAPRGQGMPPLVWHCRDLAHPPQVLRWLLPRCAGVIAISRVVERYLLAAGVKCGGPVRVVYNGIEPEDVPRRRGRDEVREELGSGPETPVLVSVGQLTPWKRWDLLLAAAGELQRVRPEARWWMVGEDTYGDNQEYARRLRAEAPDNVVFTGFREDSADLIAAADLLVHGATAEPLGRVILEAMLLGTPCVAPAAGGIPELLEAGRSGWLVPPASAEALAGGALRLLNDKELRTSLAGAAQARVRERFTAQATAEATVAVYREVLGEARDRQPRDGGTPTCG